MRRLLLFICCLYMVKGAPAQVPDFVSIRKANGRTVKNIMKGMYVSFATKSGTWLEGPVHDIRNDSVIIQQFVVRKVMTNLGIPVLDTLGSVLQPVHYAHIGPVKVKRRQNFFVRRTDDLLMIGGAGYLLLNVTNGALLQQRQPVNKKENLRKLGTSVGAMAVGLLWHRFIGGGDYTTSKHRVHYISMRAGVRPF